MPQVGRPRALDEIKRREICALVSAGCSISYAARYIGCKPITIRREALRNEGFRENLRRAELSAQLRPLGAMQRASATHWRAAAWLLERTHPEQFARRNPDTIRPEQLESSLVGIIELIAEEIDEVDLRKRVYQRLLAAMRDRLRQDRAAELPHRDPKRVRQIPHPPTERAQNVTADD